MNTIARLLFTLPILVFGLSGCSKGTSGPASVKSASNTTASVEDRIRFVENYVSFRRKYEKLEYKIMYQNNGGGMVPAPSDWDIQLLAVVPKTEIDLWVPAGARRGDTLETAWLKDVPGTIEREGITEWYNVSGSVVGIDRERSVVAYRCTSMP